MTRTHLTGSEVAERLHVSAKTVSRWAKEGKLAHLRTLGGHRRYDPEMVDRLARQLTHPHRPPGRLTARGGARTRTRQGRTRPAHQPTHPTPAREDRMDRASLPDHPHTAASAPACHGPYEHQPTETFLAPARRTAMLAEALRGVTLATWDARIAGWLCHWCDTPTFLTILGWIERARLAAAPAGRTGGEAGR